MRKLLPLYSFVFTALLLVTLSITPISTREGSTAAAPYFGGGSRHSGDDGHVAVWHFMQALSDGEMLGGFGTVCNIDAGLYGASVYISMTDVLPVGQTLEVAAIIENAAAGLQSTVAWYIDGAPMLYALFTTGEELPTLSHDFELSRLMPEYANVRIVILYETRQGERQEIYAQGKVQLQNYSRQHWMELEAPRVLSEVTSQYGGDFTLEWALENDLDDFDKEVWVNARGYSSRTDYLLWVSITYQRLNVFKGYQGNWELTQSFLVATGAPGRGTRRGVTTIPSRTRAGWVWSTHWVRPVVRFWPGTGFAFHSRILYPRSDNVRDATIGFPASAGCVRMYCEDIWYIYYNIPDGTTVVIH